MTQLILAYNFPAKHLAKLRMAAMKLGVKVRPVEKREYLQSLGSFFGTLGSFESLASARGSAESGADRDESGLEFVRASRGAAKGTRSLAIRQASS